MSLTGDDATGASAVRRKYGWKLPDAFQAAVALRAGLRLVTRDTRGFGGGEDSFVLIPIDWARNRGKEPNSKGLRT
jgi:hypothetical protein